MYSNSISGGEASNAWNTQLSRFVSFAGTPDSRLLIVVHHDQASALDMYRELTEDPGIPAFVLGCDGTARTPVRSDILQKLNLPTVDDPERMLEMGKQALRSQEAHGGRTLIVINKANLLHPDDFEFMSVISRDTSARVVLLDTRELLEKRDHLVGVSPLIMTMPGCELPEAANAAPEPIPERNADPPPAPDATSGSRTPDISVVRPERVAPPERPAPTPAKPQLPVVFLVAAISLFTGLSIGWFGHTWVTPAPETSRQPGNATIRLAGSLSGEPAPQLSPTIRYERSETAGPSVSSDTAISESPQNTTTPASSNPGDAATWLLSQSSDSYTLQLLAFENRSGLSWALRRYGSEPGLKWYEAHTGNGTRFVLFWGLFETYGEAREAGSQLPGTLSTLEPWVRSVRLLQEQVPAT